MSSKLMLIAPAALLVAACAVDPATQSYDTGFSEAVKYDIAAQTIDPDPVYAPDAAKPGDNGDKGATAVKHYRQGTVKDVQTMSTTSGSTSGGGGSGPQ